MNTLSFARQRKICRPLAMLAALLGLMGCSREPAPPAPVAGATERNAAAGATSDFDPARPVVKIETNLGAITLRLDASRAPGTVRNFLNCVNEGFYDDTLMHYVDADSIILAGGYTVERQPKPQRPPIRNEAHNGLKNLRGTVAMARDHALIDSASTQFFINLADAPQRDHRGETAAEYGYCVFGEVIEGLDVAERISRSRTTDFGGDLRQTPQPPVVITSARVIR